MKLGVAWRGLCRHILLEDWDARALAGFAPRNPLEGDRRPTFMTRATELVEVSSTSLWQMFRHSGLLSK